jgi:hypothetical protein
MILIENEIVFVSIPKCASVSVHNALENSKYKIEPTFVENDISIDNDIAFKLPQIGNAFDFKNSNRKIKQHRHQSISEIYTFLKSNVNTITIRRDYCKRFVSSFYYIFDWWISNHYKIYYKPNCITNEFIYQYFTDDVIHMIKQMADPTKAKFYDEKMKKYLVEPLFKEYTLNTDIKKIIKEKLYDNTYINFRLFDSQEVWKSGHKPTYEFDINELYKLEDMLFDKYNKEIKIGKENSMNKALSNINIIEDQKLRDWVWNKFEKQHFTKKIF